MGDQGDSGTSVPRSAAGHWDRASSGFKHPLPCGLVLERLDSSIPSDLPATIAAVAAADGIAC